MIVENAIYIDGRRTEREAVQGAAEALQERRGFAWIELYEPEAEEFEAVTSEFALHALAVRDALNKRLRPKIERFNDALFVVMNSARYDEKREAVEFGDVYLFVGSSFVVSVLWGEAAELRHVRQQLQEDEGLAQRGPMAVLHAVMDHIVDDYEPVVAGLENDIDEIEAEVFAGERQASRRIYELSREVIQFHRAAKPLAMALDRLVTADAPDGAAPESLTYDARSYLRDLRDRVLRVTEQVEGYRDLLSNILNVNLTMVAVQQNVQVQKVSSWAAILVVPTIITGVYGMNFQYMPELLWPLGYPLAIILMLGTSLALYLWFKRSGWL